MTQAIVDPAELRRFAQTLKKFNNDLIESATTLSNQLSGLAQSWRDQEHRKFAEEFEQNLKMISRFVDANNQHVPYLMRKAQLIEEYLQQK